MGVVDTEMIIEVRHIKNDAQIIEEYYDCAMNKRAYAYIKLH